MILKDLLVQPDASGKSPQQGGGAEAFNRRLFRDGVPLTTFNPSFSLCGLGILATCLPGFRSTDDNVATDPLVEGTAGLGHDGGLIPQLLGHTQTPCSLHLFG